MTPGRRPHGALKELLLQALIEAPGPLTARQLQERCGAEPPALATVLTVLNRLHRAGEVERVAGPDRELAFSPGRRPAASTAADMLTTLLRSEDRSGALLRFAGNLTHDDLAVLRGALDAPATPAPRGD